MISSCFWPTTAFPCAATHVIGATIRKQIAGRRHAVRSFAGGERSIRVALSVLSVSFTKLHHAPLRGRGHGRRPRAGFSSLGSPPGTGSPAETAGQPRL